jgi:hypothetical protein
LKWWARREGAFAHPTICLAPVLESGRRLPDSFCSRPAARDVTQKPTLLINQGFFRHQM